MGESEAPSTVYSKVHIYHRSTFTVHIQYTCIYMHVHVHVHVRYCNQYNNNIIIPGPN